MTSTSLSQPPAPQPAPWKPQFLHHMTCMQSPEFVFSTLSRAPKGSFPPFLPRARYCIFRGFWGELRSHEANSAELNEEIFGSDLLTFTTDCRMEKVGEICDGGSFGGGVGAGAGGGGPCEAVWWVREEMVQWRVKGVAFVVGGKEDGEMRSVKKEVGKWMRVLKDEGKENWSWEKEVTAHFGNLSPGMRGSFSGPPPGQPVDKPYDDKFHPVGDKVHDLNDPVARENFRVVIIKPETVESVDLSDPIKARRQLYRFDDGTGEWSHQELWP
ncbi:Hypothetical protein R9X50_00750100 [Acrodontium crateriforme]|uniref:Pyridoxamine 5'-phosphate oxidase Alr4036 family FMN-binding domain-containing protein n=1 Tax=Acrodontium crateriforme TaxID=150365 RepID=A0AAQ3MA94_9PEZI|nr:Hypothetical protein R9X50_00750100 [Acrodontium crateriforme]